MLPAANPLQPKVPLPIPRPAPSFIKPTAATSAADNLRPVNAHSPRDLAGGYDVPIRGWPSSMQRPDHSMAGQPNRQFSLLDLVFWTLWIAVLAAILRLRRSDDGTTDRAYIATMALAACIAMGALWGYSLKLRLSSAVLLRMAIVMMAFFIGSLLSVPISLAAMSHYELAALALGGVVMLVVGFRIASR